jgi:colanic acid/amylovoran biosynthesis glycosyltransferase
MQQVDKGKIIFVTTSFPYGKGEAFVSAEILEMQRRGYEIRLVPMWPRGATVHKDATTLMESTISRPIISAEMVLDAFVEFKERPLKVCKAFCSLGTWKVKHLAKNIAVFVKGVWLGRVARTLGANHIHAHWVSTTSSLAMVASMVSDIPWSFTAHRWDIKEGNLIRRKIAHARFGRFVSSNGMSYLQLSNLEKAKITVVRLGVDVPRDYSDCKTASHSDELKLVTVANLLPVKGHQYLIEAMALLRRERVNLSIIGTGPLKRRLTCLVEKHGIQSKVLFLNQWPQERILLAYRCKLFDVAVLPSVTLGDLEHEGIPAALVEAMAYGIPVISTRTGGIPELLNSDRGILCQEKSPEDLAKAIMLLLNNPSLRTQYSKRGRDRILGEFDAKITVGKLEILMDVPLIAAAVTDPLTRLSILK